MRSDQQKLFEQFIHRIRENVKVINPDYMFKFETYAAEALFGRDVIDDDLSLLKPHAKILEVGAGSLILSCQLAIEGYDVTALEPFGEGFSHFRELQKLVLHIAEEMGAQICLVNQVAEKYHETSSFDFAFSINVMEHVNDYKLVLKNIGTSLKSGATYRFICPNYTFPMETHFNIPIIINKTLTKLVFYRSIKNFKLADDPIGLWESLNWINAKSIKNCLVNIDEVNFKMGSGLFEKMLLRTFTDDVFKKRRSPTINCFISIIVALRLHKLSKYIPVNFQPVIDCKIEKL